MQYNNISEAWHNIIWLIYKHNYISLNLYQYTSNNYF